MTDEPRQRIETPFGEVTIEGRVMVLTVKQGLLLDASHTGDAERLVAEFAEGGPFATVADTREIAYADPEARSAYLHGTIPNYVATAIVVRAGTSEYLAKRFVVDHDVSRPVSIFEDLAEAIAWANEELAKHR